jgi:protein-tyrosine phosphatase
VRSVRDRTLHPIRRRRARQIVREVSQARSVLFLCTGNICRSPYAEKAFRRILDETGADGSGRAMRIESGGFLGADRPSPPEAVRLAAVDGVHLADHRSRTVDAEMLDGVDLVVVMERAHERKLRKVPGGASVPAILLGDLDIALPDRREIKDPWGHPDEVFVSSFVRVQRCLVELAGELGGNHRGSG